jgi:hypothetical protein
MLTLKLLTMVSAFDKSTVKETQSFLLNPETVITVEPGPVMDDGIELSVIRCLEKTDRVVVGSLADVLASLTA